MSVKIEYSALADCPPETLWKLFSRIDLWPQWTPFVELATWTSGEPWQEGSEIQLAIAPPPIKLKARLVESKPPFVVTFQGAAVGLRVEHGFAFIEREGKTLMATRMDIAGPAALFINSGIKDRAIAGFAQWFERLRTEAESGRAGIA